MRGLKRQNDEVGHDDALTTGLSDEVEAFLHGTLAERHRYGSFAPVWTWMNEVAHGDPAVVRDGAARPDLEDEDIEGRTRSALARAVVGAMGDRDIRELQRDVLVPLELRIIGTDLTPRRLVELVGRALYV